ncbi:glutathione S-transferase family protein [Acidocella sp.]|uniref:glutathione S-transferase family protein n=1 Tax=Acidocella sp. TaxID=50710 RepID=UPI002614C6B0|nr:glutathione S-transferase family protein [Acidocella sp.]
MTRRLYDLAAADESVRFSPFCWRTKLALAHKNLDYETVPWHFTDKPEIAFSGSDKVPVLVDGDRVVADSQAIAEYLDETYVNEPPLFGEPPARALTNFIRAWADRVLQPALVPILLPDIFPRLAAQDKDYFRSSREARLGCTLEELGTRREAAVAALQPVLAPLLATLKAQTFIAGEAPNYADHIVFGALQWARIMSSTALFEADGTLGTWMQSVLETYGL